ncbi:MAG: glycosyltransferase family 1 protein, partial [Methanobacteriota archaeon]
IFKNIDNSFSMDRYAGELARHMSEYVEVTNVSVNKRAGIKGKVFDKWVTYTLKARRNQGNWNIIVDEGYSHLLLGLDPNKTLVVCHDVNPLLHDKTPLLHVIVYKFKLRLMARARHIIAISQYTKSRILEKCPYIKPDKITVIYNGLSEKFRVINDTSFLNGFRKKYCLENQKVILHVGNNVWYKNFPSFIEAFKLLGEKDIILVKIGGITPGEKRLLEEYGLADRFLQIQNIDREKEEDLVNFYNVADVFVFPSISEGFGLPPIEAMACGCPVVSSNWSSLPEVCGDACLYVDPMNPKDIAEKINMVFDDEKLRRDLTKKGLINAKRFTWDKTVKGVINLMETSPHISDTKK